MLRFDLEYGKALEFEPRALVIAGWTGRDAAAVEHHIDELAALGVARPSAVPLYYRAGAALLTQSDSVEVLGEATSGEAEPVLLRAGGRWWLTVGSDHTDRRLEAHAVAASKQVCAKPIARRAWAWGGVAARADRLELRSQITEDGRWVDYQRGPLAKIRPLMELASGLPAGLADEDGLVLFCGTLAVLPNARGERVRGAAAMRIELADGAALIAHEYRVRPLPVVA